MNTPRHIAFVASLVAAITLLNVAGVQAADSAGTAGNQEGQLIALLQSDAPPADKAITCKKLAVIGTKDAVPALAALLPDKDLTSWARTALEVIPDPAADDALRAALDKVNGRVLIGVINSIGVRRDAQAVAPLAQRLQDADAEVAAAAAVALGHIGTAAATETLQKSLIGTPDLVRNAVAEGCILCAEKLAAAGKADDAVKIYDMVRQASVPKQRVLEATRGAILARNSAGIPLLVEQLESSDPDFFELGLGIARELAGKETTAAVAALMPKAPPARQALLMLALADRGDAAALPVVMQAVKGGSKAARLAAITSLERLGNASCIAALIEIAAEQDQDLQQAARAALEVLPGDGVNADLAARLSQAQGNTRRLLIDVVGQRRISAVPALLQAADDADDETRAAALTALGSVVGPSDLASLVTRVVTPRNAKDVVTAQQALRAACTRMPDREVCAKQLVAAMSQAPVSAQCALLEILGAMGGSEALAAMGRAAREPNPEKQDVASRLLGEWMTVDAAPVLLDVASTATDAKYETRALRGYIRLVRQFTLPDTQRAEMCRAALKAAKRDAEKKLVLEVLERYPSLDMLKLATEAAKTPSLKPEAVAASLTIAQKLGVKSPEVQQLLAAVGQDPVSVEIIKAEYGAGTQVKDVTEVLRKHVRGLPLIVLPSENYNTGLGGDPAPQVVKKLTIEYRLNGRTGKAVFAENAPILLPVPK